METSFLKSRSHWLATKLKYEVFLEVSTISYNYHFVDKNFKKINSYIKDLSTEKLIELGVQLGLKRTTLQKCSAHSLAGDLIWGWLRQDYRVFEETGEPTWHSLAKALKDIELDGISRNIITMEITADQKEMQEGKVHVPQVDNELMS